MKLTGEEGRDLVWGDLDDWTEEPHTRRITGTGRWSYYMEAVFISPDGDYYLLRWTEGATENQEEQPFEYEDPVLIEVELKTIRFDCFVDCATGETVIPYQPAVEE